MTKIATKTPDGRYLVVEDGAGPRLWRTSNPHLTEEVRARWVAPLMEARRAVRWARGNPLKTAAARRAVDEAKRALGERGPV
jgi:hypothetical protein